MYTKERVLTAIAAIIAVCSITTGAHAAGMKVGATVWYAWWNSGMVDTVASGKNYPYFIKGSSKIDAAPLYGPILAFDFAGKWSINIIFAGGNHYRPEGTFYFFMNGVGKGVVEVPVLVKYDLDPTLSYSINRYFKVFAGMKLQGYKWEGKRRGRDLTMYQETLKQHLSFINYGPGVGVGGTAPLVENLYLVVNVSGLFLRSRCDFQEKFLSLPSGTFQLFNNTVTSDVNMYGANTSVNLTYVFNRPAITLSIGGRYQYLEQHVASLTSTDKDIINPQLIDQNIFGSKLVSIIYGREMRKVLNKSKEHFYGLTFSVIYSIDFSDIGKKNEG